MTNKEIYLKLIEIVKADFENQSLSIEEYINLNREKLKIDFELSDFSLLIFIHCLYMDVTSEMESPFQDELYKFVKEDQKAFNHPSLLDFECAGYMNATPGKNDYSMFINENSGNHMGGGFSWNFYDFDIRLNPCVEIDQMSGIFIHLQDLSTIRKNAIDDVFKKLKNNCHQQLKKYGICLGCSSTADKDGNCACIRSVING